MADVYRVTSIWQGFQGAPGYTRLTFMALTDAAKLNGAGAAVRTFFQSLATQLPPGSTITVQPSVAIHESATGLLVREETMSSPPAIVTSSATAGQVYNGGVGAYVTWITNAIYEGHKVRGRTYLVPLVLTGATDGTLSTGTVTLIQNAANALISSQAGFFAVWSKTFTDTDPPVQVGGGLSTIAAATVPDKTGILRSRRD